jgi:hypothetical protein
MKRMRIIIEVDTELPRGKFNVKSLRTIAQVGAELGTVVFVATENVETPHEHTVQTHILDERNQLWGLGNVST